MAIPSYIKNSWSSDVDYIYKNLREIDRFECKSVSGGTGEEALYNGLEKGLICKTIFVEGRPAAMYGLTPIDKKSFGVVWLLGTDETRKATDILVKRSKEILDEMLELRPTIFNYVSVKNKTSIRWLKAIGFSFKPEPVTYGIAGEKFYLFYKMKEVKNV